jgi:hypothetical protein
VAFAPCLGGLPALFTCEVKPEGAREWAELLDFSRRDADMRHTIRAGRSQAVPKVRDQATGAASADSVT